MREYGEPSLIKLGGVLGRDQRKAYVNAAKQLIAVKCESCGYETRAPAGQLYKFHKKGYLCKPCSIKKRKADKKELDQALINLARNKGLL
jgi:RNase P subunit RPR2